MTGPSRKINHVPDIEAFLRKTMPCTRGLSSGPMVVNERQKVGELYVTDGATTVSGMRP